MNGATESEMQLFRNLANPNRVDMNREQTTPPAFQPNMMPVEETDFVASESSSKRSTKKRKRRPSTPPESYYEDEPDDRSAYSQTKKGRAEKIGFLMELKKLRMQGCHLTREFSTKDKLEDIKYEFERQKMNLDCINGVALMSDGLKLGLSGIEMANNKLGPFLSLHGWSESITNDMSRYNHVLERIYRRYWRQGSLNPLVELGLIIVGSMMMFHFQNKFLGPQQSTTATPPRDIPIDRNVPNTSSSRERKRPTMRRPNNLFNNMNAPPPPPNPPVPVFSNLQTVPEIREVEEKGPPTRNRNEGFDVERVEEEQNDGEEQNPIVPAYEEEDMKIGEALDIDL